METRKLAIVAGAGTAAGRQTAERLAGDGITVIAADSDIARAKNVADGISAAGGYSEACFLDPESKESAEALFKKAGEKYGTINYLAYMGCEDEKKSFLDVTADEWSHIIRTDLEGAFFCAQAAAEIMMQQGKRMGPYSIMFAVPELSASQDGSRAASCSAGWAVRGLMRSMALTLGRYDITVNALAASENIGCVPEIAETVAFAFSEKARNFTGMTMMINGGAVMS
jgi:NAD(P)-dependent dehydrogenase (short-subunit alcohol dehydrogenase family)